MPDDGAGVDGAGPGTGGGGRKQRNVEYDAFDDRYATFLLTEIIPQVTGRFSITDDPDQWGICGGSSGGNCAFTAAWLRPDRFRRVLCCLSSFVQMPGGNPLPRDHQGHPTQAVADLPAGRAP
ncbi:alpha/beta hydrolase-fold protein [Micromonospora sp. LOL_021]|uniref:alpha/beta hydrolase-fold protein n=1 Tax=Micromonospora sp. LOL_021 TaxID=3345417 RepID=UPI003A87F85F